MKSKLITALVTPFNKSKEIDEKELRKLIKNVEMQGSEGIVLGGTTGEGTSLTVSELKRIIEIANEVTNMEIIINLVTNCTYKTIDLINSIKDLRHDALMMIVPYYNKPTQKGIYDHFKTIADTFKDEKFILYNVPSRTVVKLETNTLLSLIGECPNIIGLKHSSSDFEIVKEVKEKQYTLDMLKVGADGVISVISHVFGKDMKELIEDYNKGIENIVLDKYIKELSDILFCETNPIPIKYVLSKKGYDSMCLRLPLVELSKDKQKNIDIILNL